MATVKKGVQAEPTPTPQESTNQESTNINPETQEPQVNPEPNTPVVETSPRMEELKAKKKELQQAMKPFVLNDDMESKGYKEIEIAIWGINQDIIKEESNIKAAQRQREIEDKKNKLLEIPNGFRVAYGEEMDFYYRNVFGKENVPQETIDRVNELTAISKQKFDDLVNLIIGGARIPTVTTPRTNGTTGEPRKGTLKEQIINRFEELRSQGMTTVDARRHVWQVDGFNDGSVGNYVNEYLRSKGEPTN